MGSISFYKFSPGSVEGTLIGEWSEMTMSSMVDEETKGRIPGEQKM